MSQEEGRTSKGQEAQFMTVIPPTVEPDPGYIDLPDYIDSTNVATELLSEKSKLPSNIQQWLKDTDFHRVAFNVHLKSLLQARGAKELRMSVRLVGEGPGLRPQCDDAGPKTEWVDKAVSGQVKVSTGFVGDLLKLLPGQISSPVSVEVTYKWNPKVAKVISGAAGTAADWVFNAAQGQSLDGGHEVLLTIRRPRTVSDLKLVVENAWVHYDLPARRDVAYTKNRVEIPIRFNESHPPEEPGSGRQRKGRRKNR